MKHFLPGAAVVITLFAGCGKPPTTPASAAAPKSYPQVEMRRATFERSEAASDPLPTNKCRWEITSVRIPEHSIEEHGLKNLFEDVPDKNDVVFEETERSALVHLARGDSNILFSLSWSVFSGIATSEAGSNLVAHLEQAGGAEVRPFPEIVTAGTNQAQAFAGNSLTILTGASTNSHPRTPFSTNLNFGETVTVQLLGAGQNGLTVRVAARDDRFEGYARDELDRMSQYMIGHPPIFGLSVLGTRTTLQTNEVLLLGSPTQFSVKKTISRVPKLSDLPGVGRLFSKMEMETNYFRTIWIIQPRLE